MPKEDVDYGTLAVAHERHLKVTALRHAIKNMLGELRVAEMDTITDYKAAGFTNHEIRAIMGIGPTL